MSFSRWNRRWSWHHPDLHPRLRRTASATVKPLDLAQIVAHLRLDPGAETGPEAPLLTGMLDAAISLAERHCSLAIMTQEWTLTLHGWPPHRSGLELPNPPYADLISITANGDALDFADFLVEPDDRFPAVLYPVSEFWPTINAGPLAIEIVVQCGRDDPDDVPPDIKQALLMAIATWYENRESLAQFVLTPMLELGWEPLLGPYRQLGFA